MCGFIGILSNKENRQSCFERGLAAIQPRGTSIDLHQNTDELYGYCRLPTDDVSNTSLNEISTEPVKLLFNGLITNAPELQKVYNLPTNVAGSDQQCLRVGLELYGTAFLSHCRGMFALAFVTAQHITLARDTVGIKPLYYIYDAGTFAFASEYKALRYLELPVHEVLPGQIIRFERSTKDLIMQRFRYTDAENSNMKQLLTRAVVEPTRRYLENSTKPVALLLSGGLDSSITTKLLVDGLPKQYLTRLRAFCIGEVSASDVRLAKRLAASLGLSLTHVQPHTGTASLRQLPKIVYDTESPHARVAKVALLYDALATEIKRQGIDIVIGGEGADELFYGYHRFIEGLSHSQMDQLFTAFYHDVFPGTLLQRYDRIFARHQIEGRVPYLDQAIVSFAKRLQAHQKVMLTSNGHISKLPLRELAKEIGLPAYIYNRSKEKMTSGATGKQNDSSTKGYLEQETKSVAGMSFQRLVTLLYRLQFSSIAVRKSVKTEAALQRLAAQMRQSTEEISYA